MDIKDIDVIDEEVIGADGFMSLKRSRVQNVRTDGSRSRTYTVDAVQRPGGIDAVVVIPFERKPTRVALRRCMRPVLCLGRPHWAQPGPLFNIEAVAGILEVGETQELDMIRRACAELREEAGLEAQLDAVFRVGPPVFVSAGVIAEKIHLFAVEVDLGTAGDLSGDGSPMEEGGQLMILALDEALRQCDQGVIADLKTECILSRLSRWLSQ